MEVPTQICDAHHECVLDNDGYYDDDEDGFDSDYADYADDIFDNEEYNDFEEDNDYWDQYDEHIHHQNQNDLAYEEYANKWDWYEAYNRPGFFNRDYGAHHGRFHGEYHDVDA